MRSRASRNLATVSRAAKRRSQVKVSELSFSAQRRFFKIQNLRIFFILTLFFVSEIFAFIFLWFFTKLILRDTEYLCDFQPYDKVLKTDAAF